MPRPSMSRIKTKFKSGFLRAQRGAMAPIIVASIIPLFGAIGGAVDLANIYMVRSQMRDAVDNAALAGGRLFKDSSRDTQVTNFFNSNLPLLANGNVLNSFQITQAKVGAADQLTVTAEVDVKLLMMQVFGVQNYRVKASATVERSGTGLELVLALDNTDSMSQADAGGGKTRIEALRDASRELVTTLYGGNETNPNLMIGVIPYTSMVNVGKILQDEGTARGVNYIEPRTGYVYNPSDPLGWKGCIDESPTNNAISAASDPNQPADWVGALDTKELAPGVGGQPLFRPYLSESFEIKKLDWVDPGQTCSEAYSFNNGSWKGGVEGETAVWVPGETVYVPKDPTCKPKAADPAKGKVVTGVYGNRYVTPLSWPAAPYRASNWDQVDKTTGPAAKFYPLTTNPNDGGTPNLYCPQEAINLKVRTHTEVDTYLASMISYGYSGGTMSNVAMGWAYRMLTPALPLAGPPKSSSRPKVIILMTDGFLWQDSNVDWRSPYGYPAENRLLVGPADMTTDTTAWRTARYEALEVRLKRWCTNARAEGIRVYTVAFTMPASDPRSALYRTCATEPGMYYHAADAAALSAAFGEIATSLASLRLVK